METGMRVVGFATFVDSEGSKDNDDIEKLLSTPKTSKGALNVTKTARKIPWTGSLQVFLWALAN